MLKYGIIIPYHVGFLLNYIIINDFINIYTSFVKFTDRIWECSRKQINKNEGRVFCLMGLNNKCIMKNEYIDIVCISLDVYE